MPAISLTTAALLLAGAGTAVSTVGAVKAGRAAKRAGRAQASVNEAEAQLEDYNAAQAEIAAQDAIERGAFEESRYRADVRAMIGSQRASYAGQGVDVSSGTAAEVQADTAELGELDALQIRSNAAREAFGIKVQGYESKVRALMLRRAGANAIAAGNATGNSMYLSAAGGVLSSGANLLALRAGFRGRDTLPAASTP